jgi:hypothetical protein
LAIFQAALGSSWLLVAIQVEQDQFADWSHRTDASGRMFEYNLIPFFTDTTKPGWFHLRKGCGDGEACERGEETRIINQQ